ncbi:transposable element Tcb2 transposase [Trichonephila clavipes]|nr:transposable element Tcb2 transposase [Trichonephila clavipes]
MRPVRFMHPDYATFEVILLIIRCSTTSCGRDSFVFKFGLAIHQNDHQARRRFVEWAQNEIAVVPDFHKRILFSDEAHFWLNGYVNKQNCRIWSEANPQVYVETPLHPEKLTVWCAIWAGGIIGPYFFKNDEGHNVTVNGERYRAMITNFFIPELNNHDVKELWFQQDGATSHTARATIDLLKDTFGDHLISRFGPVNWPPRPCDLTPLDYFLWSYVKSLVYADKPQTLDHLEDNIRRVIADIRPQMLEKVIENWTSRLDYIRASRGSPMPEIIFKMSSNLHWCAKIKDEVEKLAYQLNEEAERTDRPIRRLSKLEEGRSVTSVAAEFGIAHSIVSRLWRQFQTTGTAIRGFSSGHPRGTTPADDRYIVLQARRNRRQTAGEISRHTTQATGRQISRFTVARRLHGGGLFARRPVRCVSLTPAHRRRRSLWGREHRNWRDNEWGRVLFTDESRFSLSCDSHRILIWRERGSRNHPSNIIERDRYGGRGVLVWGGIMLGSRTDLHIFDAGSVNGTRYCNEILLPYVRLFRGAMGLQFLFMDDNAPCHRTVAAEQLLESRRLAARTLPPVTIRELRLALQDEWAAMPQQLIDTLILRMGRRCETCLAVRGDHIPY